MNVTVPSAATVYVPTPSTVLVVEPSSKVAGVSSSIGTFGSPSVKLGLFDAFKQAADKVLTEFAGGSDAIVKLVDELLKAQAVDLETSFKFQEVDKLNAKISKLENRVAELNDLLSRHDK